MYQYRQSTALPPQAAVPNHAASDCDRILTCIHHAAGIFTFLRASFKCLRAVKNAASPESYLRAADTLLSQIRCEYTERLTQFEMDEVRRAAATLGVMDLETLMGRFDVLRNQYYTQLEQTQTRRLHNLTAAPSYVKEAWGILLQLREFLEDCRELNSRALSSRNQIVEHINQRRAGTSTGVQPRVTHGMAIPTGGPSGGQELQDLGSRSVARRFVYDQTQAQELHARSRSDSSGFHHQYYDGYRY